MQIVVSFHVSRCKYCRWKLMLPLLPSAEASTTIFGGSFHELSWASIHPERLPPTSIYFPERRKLPAAFMCAHRLRSTFVSLPKFPSTSINFLKLNFPPASRWIHRLPFTSASFHIFPRTFIDFHRLPFRFQQSPWKFHCFHFYENSGLASTEVNTTSTESKMEVNLFSWKLNVRRTTYSLKAMDDIFWLSLL